MPLLLFFIRGFRTDLSGGKGLRDCPLLPTGRVGEPADRRVRCAGGAADQRRHHGASGGASEVYFFGFSIASSASFMFRAFSPFFLR